MGGEVAAALRPFMAIAGAGAVRPLVALASGSVGVVVGVGMASVSLDNFAAAASAKSGMAGGADASVLMWTVPLEAEELARRLVLGDEKDALRPNEGLRSRSLVKTLVCFCVCACACAWVWVWVWVWVWI